MENSEPVNFENFSLVFDKYGPVIYGIVLRSVKENISLAEKLTGIIFVYLYHNKHSYNPNKKSFIAWMLAATIKVMKENGFAAHLYLTSDIVHQHSHQKGNPPVVPV